MSASLLNQVGGSYATLLDLWRKFRLSVAVMRQGYPPTGADWKEMCVGRVDTVDTGGDRIAITGRDEGAVLLDKYIDTARTYGSGGGIAMETVIQTMLDDNNTGVTLYCPVSPSYLMNSWTQPKDRLMSALQAVADKAGFVLKYRYDSANALRLTLYQPNRTASVEDWSMGPAEYTAVPLNKIDIQGVRNFIKLRFAHPTLGTQTVIYPHMAGTGTLTAVAGAGTFSSSQAGIVQNGAVVIVAGVPYAISGFNGTTLCTLSTQPPDGTAPGVPTFSASAFTLHGTLSGAGSTTSITRFGRRDMEIDLSFATQVTDPTKAQAMADAVGPDMEFPNLEQQIETSCAWFVQLHDYGRFLANRINYDQDQLAGITSIRHDGQNGYIKTTLGGRGKPAGKYTGWRYINGAQNTTPPSSSLTFAECVAKITATSATQVTVTVTANPSSPPQQVQLVGVTGGASLASGTAAGTWVTPNGTNNVWVFNRAAINGGVGQAQFRAGNTSSFPNDDDLVSIEEQGRDTVYLAMRARVTGQTATTMTVRVAVADPYPQGAASVSIATQDSGVGSATTPASPQTVTPAATITEAAGTFVDYTVTRPVFGSGAGRVTFTASAANRTTDSDAIDVPPQDRDTQSISVRVTRISETTDQIVVRVEAITPNTAATVTVNYDGGGLTVSPATGGTFAATTSFGTTGHIDYTITRDTQGGTPRRVAFTVTAAGSIDGTDGVDVPSNSTRNRCRLKRSGVLSVSTGTNTAVGFDTEDYDVGSLHDTVTNNSRVIIPTGGGGVPWLFGGIADWANNVDATRRKVSIWKNGSLLFDGALVTAVNGDSTVTSCFWVDVPADADYYEMVVWHNAAGSVNLSIGSTRFTALTIW
jgi:hypothetical protein